MGIYFILSYRPKTLKNNFKRLNDHFLTELNIVNLESKAESKILKAKIKHGQNMKVSFNALFKKYCETNYLQQINKINLHSNKMNSKVKNKFNF